MKPYLAGEDVLAHRCCVYGLVDPREPEIVQYVGQTCGLLVSRYGAHLIEAYRTLGDSNYRGSRNRRLWWIRDLMEQGLAPSVVLLETCIPSELGAAEDRWIEHFRQMGQAQHNRTAGITGLTRRAARAHRRVAAMQQYLAEESAAKSLRHGDHITYKVMGPSDTPCQRVRADPGNYPHTKPFRSFPFHGPAQTSAG